MSFQGKMNGGQARNLFLAYNVKAGSDVVDMSRNYNTGDKYSNQISNGNQIDLAFAEINANEGEEIFNFDIPDYTDGFQMKLKFTRLALLANVTAPVWQTIPDQVMNQNDAWPIADLDTICLSVGVTTFTVTTGVLPTGITLNANGTFAGTATNIGAGSVAFTATDDNGVSESNILEWDVN